MYLREELLLILGQLSVDLMMFFQKAPASRFALQSKRRCNGKSLIQKLDLLNFIKFYLIQFNSYF